MRTDLILDRVDHRIVASAWQDVEPVLDRNKALQNDPQRRGDLRHIGTIPNIILVKWMNEEFGKFIKRKLADPDWRWLRTDK